MIAPYTKLYQHKDPRIDQEFRNFYRHIQEVAERGDPGDVGPDGADGADGEDGEDGPNGAASDLSLIPLSFDATGLLGGIPNTTNYLTEAPTVFFETAGSINILEINATLLYPFAWVREPPGSDTGLDGLAIRLFKTPFDPATPPDDIQINNEDFCIGNVWIDTLEMLPWTLRRQWPYPNTYAFDPDSDTWEGHFPDIPWCPYSWFKERFDLYFNAHLGSVFPPQNPSTGDQWEKTYLSYGICTDTPEVCHLVTGRSRIQIIYKEI